MRILFTAVAAALVLAATPSLAQPEPAPAVAAVQPGVAAGERLAGSILNEALINRTVDGVLPTLASRYVRELDADPAYRSAPAATKEKVRAFFMGDASVIIKEEMIAAAAEARLAAAKDLASAYRAEDLGALAAFFESPAGQRIMTSLVGVAVDSAAANGGEVKATEADAIAALSGEDIKALAVFSTTPAGRIFGGSDGGAIFGRVTSAFDKALEARGPAVERRMQTSLCNIFEPREARRLGIALRCSRT